jgi:starvation-inducible DNA-binding protein
MNPEIGLPEKSRTAIVKILQALLADEFVLYVKTRDAHWNVTGPHFNHLHAFFEEQYDGIEEHIDEVAERIRQLGGHAPGSMAEYLKLARLKEGSGKVSAAQDFLAALLSDQEAIIRQLRSDVDTVGNKLGDAGTNDFLTGLMEDHEKMAWMLRASLKE